MKILQPGKSKEELAAKLKATKTFRCTTCECVFTADNDEYREETDYQYTTYHCTCPNCCRRAYEIMGSELSASYLSIL